MQSQQYMCICTPFKVVRMGFSTNIYYICKGTAPDEKWTKYNHPFNFSLTGWNFPQFY